MKSKPLKITIICISVAVGLCLLCGLLVNLLLTSERLVPLIKGYATEYLDAEVELDEAEGTFFSTFPRVGVRLRNGSVVSHAFLRSITEEGDTLSYIVDSLRTRRDTLLRFDQVVVGVNALDYLLGDGSISLGYLRIDNPTIRLVTDSAARYSWDIVRPDDTPTTDTSTTDFNIRHLRINNARVIYFDRPQAIAFFADSLTLRTDGLLSLDAVDADVELSTRKTSLGIDWVRYFRRLPLAFEGHISFDDKNDTCVNKYRFEDARLTVAETGIDIDGYVRPDTSGADINITYKLSSPSVDKLFAAIPTSIVSTPVNVKQGKVDMNGSIVGRTDSLHLPVIRGKAYIENVRAQYENMPREIEDLTADFNMLIDDSRPDSSYVNLDIFHVKGGKSEIEATVRLTQLLARTLVDCRLKAHVDMTDVCGVIPIDNTRMSGLVDADIKTNFRLSDLQHYNLSSLQLHGQVSVDNLNITNDTSNLEILTSLRCRFRQDDTLGLGARIERFRFRHDSTRIGVRDAFVAAKTISRPDTSQVTPIEFVSGVRRGFVRTDSIKFLVKNIRTKDYIRPSKADPKRPIMHSTIKCDTIFAGILGIGSFTKDLLINVDAEAYADTMWHTRSDVAVARIAAKTPFFRLPIITTDVSAEQKDEAATLDRMTVRMGSSQVRLSGRADRIFGALYRHEPFSVELSSEADTIDFNQIASALITDTTSQNISAITAVNDSTMTIATDSIRQQVSADSLPTGLLLVPKHVSFNFDTKIGKLLWDKAVISDIRGRVKTNNGAMHMTGLVFHMGEGKAITTLAYKAWPHVGRARMNIFTHMERFDIKQITTMLSLDSLVPALRPMSGAIDCYMGAEVELDSGMNVNLQTARASIHLGGQKLTVLDNDDFKKIAKSLFFKNKEKNIIDTLSVNVLVDSGRIQVLPFVTEMDRYRMAVGGKQDLMMNLDYHVSVLKSPLPFRIGVNIRGNIEDFNIGVSTAKLRKQVTADKLQHNDSIAKLLRDLVLADSYTLSGLPMPDKMKEKIGHLMGRTSFAVRVENDEETEQDRRDAELARRMQAEGAVDPDSLTNQAPTDSTATDK